MLNLYNFNIFLREIFLKYITHFPALVNRVYWRVFNLFLMSHGHHYKHQPLLYLGVVQWCHQALSRCAGLGLPFTDQRFSHWWFALLSAPLVKLSGGNCGIWELLPPTPILHDPGCTFKTALAVLYVVYTIQNVFLYSTGEISVSGVVTSCQSLLF